MFAIAFWCAKRSGMWNDEFSTVAELGIGKSFFQFLSDDLTVYPLGWNPFTLIARYWWYIHPYSDTWLWMLCIVSACIAVGFVAATGKLLGGKLGGVISALLLATAHSVMYEATVEFRYYTFTVLFASIILYLYVKVRTDQARRRKLCACLLGFCMFLAVSTQILTALAFPVLFFVDLCLLLRRHLHWPDLLVPYGIAFVLVLVPLCLRSFLLGSSPALNVWSPAEAPSFTVLMTTFWQLLDQSLLTLAIFVIGIISTLASAIYILYKYKDNTTALKGCVLFVLTIAPFLDTALLWALSLMLHKTLIGILRYYVWIMPFLAVSAGFGLTRLCDHLVALPVLKNPGFLAPFVKISLALLLGAAFFGQLYLKSSSSPKRQFGIEAASKWIRAHVNLSDPSNMYVFGTGYPQGILMLYFRGWGLDGSADIPQTGGLGGGPVISATKVDQAIEQTKPQTIYYLEGKTRLDTPMQQVLKNSGYCETRHLRDSHIYIYKLQS
ncbi:MAG: DUF2723 domain-containing protein [Coriobacteriales bacterium]|nr:DUF2723 domain-containing protein [Coriobacteriales bacterium]